jgi:hypothetical protein
VEIDFGHIFPPKHMRYWTAASALWALGVIVVFVTFDPFGRYTWREVEWLKFSVTLLAPSALGLLGIALFTWAGRDEDNPSPPQR